MTRALPALLALLFVGTTAHAAVQKTREVPQRGISGYMSFTDMQQTPQSNAQIMTPIASFSKRFSVSGPAEGRRRGAAVLEDIVITRKVDTNSPTLTSKLLRGEITPEFRINLTRMVDGARQVYYQVVLQNVQVTSYQLLDEAGGGVGMETLTLSYQEITGTVIDGLGDPSYQWRQEDEI